MKIKTSVKNNANSTLIWSYCFLVVLLITAKVSKCQSDSGDDDEVGGSLLSLAAPSTNNENGKKDSTSNLFANPLQDKLKKIDAISKLAEKNGK